MWDVIEAVYVWVLLGTVAVLGLVLVMMGISWTAEKHKKTRALEAQRVYFAERARILGTAPAAVPADDGADVQVIGGVEFRRMRPRRQLGEEFYSVRSEE